MTPGRQVLVVDDNPGFLRAASSILQAAPQRFTVLAARSGSQALASLDSVAPGDLAFVVLDFRLPDLNADEVLLRLRAHDHHRAVPVLVITQADWAHDHLAAVAAGAQHFGLKPSRVRALRELLLAFWKEHGEGRDPCLPPSS